VADVSLPAFDDAHPVRIEISARSGAPPSGVVVVDGGPERRFDGWLGLLSLLTDALDPNPPSGAPGGLGRELAPRRDAELGEGM
jgi:hypothetical protein